MRLEHDFDSNMAYLRLGVASPRAVKKTVVVQDWNLPCDLGVDLDEDGRIIGIEIFDARRALDPVLLDSADS